MKLRALEQKDAPYMLEWMHDASVTGNLNADFAGKTLNDCEEFIQNALAGETAIHLAIVDQSDTYQGTVSLKHIDKHHSTAEFAITVRRSAMGTGCARDAMKEILKWKINGTMLKYVYWCVKPENVRAVRFYDKNGYTQTDMIPDAVKMHYEGQDNLIWYIWENSDKEKIQGDEA